MPRETITVDTSSGPGTVELSSGPAGLVLLTHGAGGAVDTPDLDAVRESLLAAHVGVGLVTQPYRVAGRRSPPKPEAQDAAWLEIVAAVRDERPLVLGGRSNGARVACRTATNAGALAVIALAFPLHPPGRPEKTRLDELDAVDVPVLVVQGERDPFGLPPQARGRSVVVVPGDHALKCDTNAVADAVNAFVTSQIARA